MEFNRFDISYMRMAHLWAKNSHCKRKQVGAFIVKNNTIISDGFNGTPKGMDNCCEGSDGETLWYVVHAEANAISKLAQSTNSAEGATLYITLSPCKECSKLILSAGIKRVVYDKQHSDVEGLKMLEFAGVEIGRLQVDNI